MASPAMTKRPRSVPSVAWLEVQCVERASDASGSIS